MSDPSAAGAPASVPLAEPLFSEPTFNEGQVTPDPTYFHTPHPSDSPLYAQLNKLHGIVARPFPRSRAADGDLFSLAPALGSLGAGKVADIGSAGRIVFHAAGDTGSVKGPLLQDLAPDAMAAETRTAAAADQPAFFFHLGDVVYSFAEAKYYYDQFYETYRNYAAPIFAIPGNHDGMLPPPPVSVGSLDSFTRNFCAPGFGISPDALTLHRTTMTQPGVYFTLDAPFVRIIGLYSNALEDPGLISSQGGMYPNVPDYQLTFLQAQLARIRAESYAGAVLLAVHHPPFTWYPPGAAQGMTHGGSPAMLREIDTLCAAAGVYPHAILSGHAHNYQRYTRSLPLGGQTLAVPFVVCGSGGHGLSALARAGAAPPAPGSDVSYLDAAGHPLRFEYSDDQHYGYLRVTADARQLRIAFRAVSGAGAAPLESDVVTVDLATHTLAAP